MLLYAIVPIVLGYVPHPQGQAALREAIRLAQVLEDEVHVLNSASGDQRVDAAFASTEDIAGVERQLSDAGLRHQVRHEVSGKSGADSLLALADEVGATLIVIGLRRRSPTGKLLFGSNAQQILLQSECPVLAVKADSD
jgi:nucleotide-binding universal stress UspA family protein